MSEMREEHVHRKGALVRRGDTVHTRSPHVTKVHKKATGGGASPTGGRNAIAELVKEGELESATLRLSPFREKAYQLLSKILKRTRFDLRDGTAVLVDSMGGVGRVGRGTIFSYSPRLASNTDLSKLDIAGSKFTSHEVAFVDFSDGVLDGSSFDYADPHAFLFLQDCVFRRASMRNMSFEKATFCGDCDLGEVDLEGSSFEGCGVHHRTRINLRGSNITSEQFDQLLSCSEIVYRMGAHPVDDTKMSPTFIYDRISTEQAWERFGIDEETLGVLIWSGGVEIRSNATSEKVDPLDYNPHLHHIPQWEATTLGTIQ